MSDINLVLNSNKVEPLYGLELMHSPSSEESAITGNVQRNIYSPAVISIGAQKFIIVHRQEIAR